MAIPSSGVCPQCARGVQDGWRVCPACAAPLLAGNGGRETETIFSQSHSSSSGIEEGRFPAGTVLAGRYRVLGLLGRGGMGEVYRANDLKLGQPVALKFLPDSTARNPDRLARFHSEVRIARQVSHPNVCRVYDIGETDGSVFLSMEYIDGEDLCSLLRRIGRLPGDKALEIARHLCAGLAAAHDKGVLHRDLKPANIMLDGRGQLLITDFGLAGMADRFARPSNAASVREGTPAYQAPEQRAGRGVSVRSDIYSLGLILHEMFTGKRATLESGQATNSPTTIVKDLDPAVEKVILRCLEADPQNRPQSAVAVARALPGGDPLAAALAAGDTPSPEMVAAAGDNEGIAVRTAAIALGAVLVGLAVVAVLGHKTNILEQTPFDKSPAVLEQKARDLIRSFGYTEAPVDRAYGFSYDTEFQQYGEGLKDPAAYRALLAKGSPPVIRFWYRQSPQYLVAGAEQHIVSLANPPPIGSGMVSMNLNPQGRLVEFTAVPPQVEKPAQAAAPPDWQAFFAAAGLDMARFTPVDSEWLPLVSFDTRGAWTGVYPNTNLPLRIEAASWRGRPVNFQMIGPWTKPSRLQPIFNLPVVARIIVGILLILTALAALLAWRHFRLNRGDAQGAFRLAVFVFSVEMMEWLCVADHFSSVEEIFGWMEAVSGALLAAGFFWTFYMALEPYVRRRWPQSIIAWSRLLGGGVRDPVVGGNLLIGVACGVGVAAFWRFYFLIVQVYDSGAGRLELNTVVAAPQAAGEILHQVILRIGFSLVLFFLFFLLQALLRKPWIAAAAFIVLLVALTSRSVSHPLLAAALTAIGPALILFITIRFGVLAMTVNFFTGAMLLQFPATTDLSTWYAGSTLFAYAVVLALAGYAFHTAIAGRPLFKAEFLDAD